MMNNIFCIKWGDKYDDSYVEKLKKQCEKNCSVDFNFYCFTDNPKQDYDIQLPTYLDLNYDEDRGFFWAWRKCYMFSDDYVGGDKFLFLDLLDMSVLLIIYIFTFLIRLYLILVRISLYKRTLSVS